MITESQLIDYFKSLGIDIHTSTKARGHQGFFLDGRIDISKNLPKEKVIPTLLHEFAHYIHSKLEKNTSKTGGSLKVLFNSCLDFEEELLRVTNFVDEHSKCETLFKHKEMVKSQIKSLDLKIKEDYPEFQRSKPFKAFNKAIRGTQLKYLLKYDKVRIMPWFFLGKEEILSISRLDTDFPNLKPAFKNYIRLKSLMRKQKRISNRISKLQRYYRRPTELFARFVEGLYLDNELAKQLAPNAYYRFYELLNQGYYKELGIVFNQL